MLSNSLLVDTSAACPERGVAALSVGPSSEAATVGGKDAKKTQAVKRGRNISQAGYLISASSSASFR